MNYLEIKSIEDKLDVAKILIKNGYTVCLAKVKVGNNSQTVVTYEKKTKGETL